jgi:hypothetical protein
MLYAPKISIPYLVIFRFTNPYMYDINLLEKTLHEA